MDIIKAELFVHNAKVNAKPVKLIWNAHPANQITIWMEQNVI